LTLTRGCGPAIKNHLCNPSRDIDMTYALTLTALVLAAFTLLGIVAGILCYLQDDSLHRMRLRHAALDGLALGMIVVALYWACAIGYGVDL
jgi:hypothetical protein